MRNITHHFFSIPETQGTTAYFDNLIHSSEWSSQLSRLKNSNVFSSSHHQLDLFNLGHEEIAAIVQSCCDTDIIYFYAHDLSRLPYRVTPKLIAALNQGKQIFIEVSFNHFAECSINVFNACNLLADIGCVLNNQMFLIKDVNDDAEVIKRLNHLLLMMRVRPSYIHLPFSSDVTSEKAIEILEALRGWTSGLAVPHLLIHEENRPAHKALPNYIKSKVGSEYLFRNYKNDTFRYRES